MGRSPYVLAVAVAMLGCRSVLGIDDPIATDCDVPASYGVATAGTPGASRSGSGSGTLLIETAYLDASQTPDLLQVELYGNNGVFAGVAPQPGTYMLGSAEAQYATCGACIFVTADLHFDGSGAASYGAYYLASGGTLRIDKVDTALDGELLDVTFQHVAITLDANNLASSTPVDDGCTATIDDISFAASYPK